MHPSSLPRWMRPAPDSALADTLRLGRPVWLEAVHLLWTVWVFVVPMFTPRGYDLRWLGLTLLSYPVFLALYVAALLLPRRRVEACALGMIVLCMSLFAWYPPALTYFVFGCVMLGAGQERPLWVRLLQILLLSSVMLACARWAGYPWDTLAWLPVTTLVIGTLVHVERMEKRHAAELRLSHEEVRRLAALAERERIGRDLHDLLGHTLSLVALKSDLAARLVERDPLAARHEITEVSQVAREALAQVRHAVTGIRAAGLAAELASARLLLESAGIVLACEHMENAVPLPPEIETVLAMSLREAVTNVQRHARASRVEASLACTVNEVVLDIRDDGTGRAGAPGNGLAGMRERVEALGGRMRIESVPGKGTGIRVTLPVPAAHLPVDELSVRLSTPA